MAKRSSTTPIHQHSLFVPLALVAVGLGGLLWLGTRKAAASPALPLPQRPGAPGVSPRVANLLAQYNDIENQYHTSGSADTTIMDNLATELANAGRQQEATQLTIDSAKIKAAQAGNAFAGFGAWPWHRPQYARRAWA